MIQSVKQSGSMWGYHTRQFLAGMAHRELRTNGGFSYSLTGASPLSGYVVSLYGYEKQLPVSHVSYREILQYAESTKHIEAPLVGGWIDNGICYLDRSIVLPSLQSALEFAINNRQLAVYDVARRQAVTVASHVRTFRAPVPAEFADYHLAVELWRNGYDADNRLQWVAIRSPIADSKGLLPYVERLRVDVTGNDASFYNSTIGKLTLFDNPWLRHTLAQVEHENRRYVCNGETS